MTSRFRAACERLALGLVPLLAASCIRGTLPAREYYRLTIPVPPPAESSPAPTAAGALRGTIAVMPFVVPGVYGGHAVVFRIDETEYGTYPAREWALPLGDMLGMLTESVLRRTPLTDGEVLFDPPSRRRHSYLFRGTVREFEEVDRGREVFVSVRLDAQLLRANDDSVLWSGQIGRERPVPEGTMPAIVTALSSLADEVLTELVAQARTTVRASATSAVRGTSSADRPVPPRQEGGSERH